MQNAGEQYTTPDTCINLYALYAELLMNIRHTFYPSLSTVIMVAWKKQKKQANLRIFRLAFDLLD